MKAKDKSSRYGKRDIQVFTKNIESEWDLMNEFYEISTPKEFAFEKIEIFR